MGLYGFVTATIGVFVMLIASASHANMLEFAGLILIFAGLVTSFLDALLTPQKLS